MNGWPHEVHSPGLLQRRDIFTSSSSFIAKETRDSVGRCQNIKNYECRENFIFRFLFNCILRIHKRCFCEIPAVILLAYIFKIGTFSICEQL